MFTFRANHGVVEFRCQDTILKNALKKHLTLHDDKQDRDVTFYTEEEEFPIGLWNYVRGWLSKHEYIFTATGLPEIVPAEVDPYILFTADDPFELRPFQVTCVRKLLSVPHSLVQSPPGSGKTEIWAATLKHLNSTSITIAGYWKHVEQMYDRLQRRHVPDVGLIGEGGIIHRGKNYVAVAATVYNAIKHGDEEITQIVKDAHTIGFDETHHLGTAFSWQIIASRSNAVQRHGLSAYPFEDDANPYSNPNDLTLIGLTEELVYKLPAS